MTNEDIINRVLGYEGGFVNNPADKGGPTNFGITASELGRKLNLNGPATIDQVRSMTRQQAIDIYTSDYISVPHFDQIEDGNLRMVVVDSGVLHGTGRAAKWLQQALGVTVDGSLGQQTFAALAAANAAAIGKAVLATRFKFIGSLITATPSQAVFAAGWLNRVADLLQFI